MCGLERGMKEARKEEKEGKKFKRRKCQACSSGQSLEPDGGGERGAPVERSEAAV